MKFIEKNIKTVKGVPKTEINEQEDERHPFIVGFKDETLFIYDVGKERINGRKFQPVTLQHKRVDKEKYL